MKQYVKKLLLLVFSAILLGTLSPANAAAEVDYDDLFARSLHADGAFAEAACAELAQAALKLRRAMDGKNPTPKTVEECRRDLCEEYLDVIICTGVLNLDLPPEGVERKMLRWMKRLGIRNGDCGTKGPPGALGVDPRGERGT